MHAWLFWYEWYYFSNFTWVEIAQQNKRVECKYKACLMFQENFHITFWGECIFFRSITKWHTIYDVIWYNSKYWDVVSFWVLCPSSFASNETKIAPCSWKCVFSGYPYRKKEWKLYDVETAWEIFVS